MGDTLNSLVALKDFLVVVETEKESTTQSGIFIPTNTPDRNLIRRGKVVKVGESEEIKVGSNVLFDARKSIEIEIESERFRVIKQEDVVGLFLE